MGTIEKPSANIDGKIDASSCKFAQKFATFIQICIFVNGRVPSAGTLTSRVPSETRLPVSPLVAVVFGLMMHEDEI